jgi:hypothetical protein
VSQNANGTPGFDELFSGEPKPNRSGAIARIRLHSIDAPEEQDFFLEPMYQDFRDPVKAAAYVLSLL